MGHFFQDYFAQIVCFHITLNFRILKKDKKLPKLHKIKIECTRFVKIGPVNQWFRPGSAIHDFCISHGSANPGHCTSPTALPGLTPNQPLDRFRSNGYLDRNDKNQGVTGFINALREKS